MSNWTTKPQPFGANRSPALFGTSSLDGMTMVPVAVDPATGALITEGGGSGGGGTQYTQGGATVANPTGNALIYFNNSNQPIAVTATNPLPVTGGGGGIQYTELATTTPAMGTLSLGRYQTSLPTLTNGQMNEPMLDSSSRMFVNVANTSVAVTGTFFQNTQPVSLTSTTITGSVAVTQSGSWTDTVTQATAASLNATVVGTGTFVTQSTLAAETTKVIGVTRTADGSGNLLTSTTNALDINIKSGSIANTSFAVTQATAANLNATVTGTVVTTPPSNASTNIVQWNGTTLTTAAALADLAASPTAPIVGAQLYAFDNGTGYNRLGLLNSGSDGQTGGRGLTVGNLLYNGTNYDRTRSATSAAATTGTGLAGAGALGIFNTSAPTVSNGNYERLQLDVNANLKTTSQVYIGATNVKLNTYENLFTTNATTTVTASTAYISSIVITTDTGGTTSTVTIQDGQATPQILVNSLITTTAATGPTIYNFQTPIQLTTGIKVITAGAVAATVSVWINYYQ